MSGIVEGVWIAIKQRDKEDILLASAATVATAGIVYTVYKRKSEDISFRIFGEDDE